MDSLRSLDISLCGNISDAALNLLADSSSPPLEELYLGENKGITDAGLVFVSRMKSLVRLDLGGCRKVTDKGVAALCGLMEGGRSVDDGEFNFGRFNLANGSAATRQIPAADDIRPWIPSIDGGLPLLSFLCLRGCLLITDRGVVGLATLPSLSTCVLNGCANVSDVGLLVDKGVDVRTHLCMQVQSKWFLSQGKRSNRDNK
jgi:hypothetical protein